MKRYAKLSKEDMEASKVAASVLGMKETLRTVIKEDIVSNLKWLANSLEGEYNSGLDTRCSQHLPVVTDILKKYQAIIDIGR